MFAQFCTKLHDLVFCAVRAFWAVAKLYIQYPQRGVDLKRGAVVMTWSYTIAAGGTRWYAPFESLAQLCTKLYNLSLCAVSAVRVTRFLNQQQVPDPVHSTSRDDSTALDD